MERVKDFFKGAALGAACGLLVWGIIQVLVWGIIQVLGGCASTGPVVGAAGGDVEAVAVQEARPVATGEVAAGIKAIQDGVDEAGWNYFTDERTRRRMDDVWRKRYSRDSFSSKLMMRWSGN